MLQKHDAVAADRSKDKVAILTAEIAVRIGEIADRAGQLLDEVPRCSTEVSGTIRAWFDASDRLLRAITGTPLDETK